MPIARGGRTVPLTTAVLCGLVLVFVVAGSFFLVLRDAAAERAELARQISTLRDELSRLAQNPPTTTTAVLPATTPPPPPVPAPPPVPTTTVPQPPATRVTPAPSPPPTVIVNPPPPPAPPTCTTLPILNRCL